jgi:hypothetical protein
VFNGGESWSVTYEWTGNPELVKGFPRMKAHPSNLPVPFWNVSALQFTAEWDTYVKGKEDDSPEEQAIAFDDIYLRSNAALDVFLSDNATNSTLVGPPIEIMIWYWYTPTIIPLGYHESTPGVDTIEVDGTNFQLYHGFNAQGQHVFSWLAERNLTSVDADYSPLFRYIWEKGLLSGALWLGQLEFGFEVMHSGEQVVSEVKPGYTLRIIRDGDPDAHTTTSSATPTSTSKTASSTAAEATTTSPDTAAATTSSAGTGLSPYGWDTGFMKAMGIWSFIFVPVFTSCCAYNLL